MKMFKATEENLADHFINDLGIQPEDLIFMFSGISGLGRLENGLDTIELAIERAIPKGTLIVPTFSYSWSEGKQFDKHTKCPEMGSFSNYTLDLDSYKRTNNPNFSVSIRANKHNKKMVKHFLEVGDDCFGHNSIFEKVVNYSQTNRAWILLLGGAFNDVKYRSTFIHYAQQKITVPHRYVKSFDCPNNSGRCVTQLVRCFSEDEYVQKGGSMERNPFNFPIEEDYTAYGDDLASAGLIIKKDFGYCSSRMVSVKESVDFYIKKIKSNPNYCIHKASIPL
jgi:aminoglycoside N3'-acetyltransferase